MQLNIEPDLPWTDHYVKYGFIVRKRLLEPAFVREALAEIRRLLGNNLPLNQWTNANTPTRLLHDGTTNDVLARVYDQPGIAQSIATMFGSCDEWDGKRFFQVFLNPYNPEARAELSPRGHIDFVECPVPMLGSGFMFQASLVDAEPFSGNLTLYPGTHTTVQKALMTKPDWRFPDDADKIDCPTTWEFVAEAGDVVLFHHLVMHAGNASHAANRTPRLALHCQATCKSWLNVADPAQPDISPWRRSLATNGLCRAHRDEEATALNHKAARAKAVALP